MLEKDYEERVQAIDSSITTNMALACSLMAMVMALGRGDFHVDTWKLYSFFFSMIVIILTRFLLAMLVAKRKFDGFRWIKEQIKRDRDDLLKVTKAHMPSLTSTYEDNVNSLLEIEYELIFLEYSMKGQFATNEKLYLASSNINIF